MEILTYIFAQQGLLNQFLGGYFFLVPLIIMSIFLIYLYVNRVSGDNIMMFLFIGVLLFTIDDIFQISTNWTIMIIILILLVIGTYFYNYITRIN